MDDGGHPEELTRDYGGGVGFGRYTPGGDHLRGNPRRRQRRGEAEEEEGVAVDDDGVLDGDVFGGVGGRQRAVLGGGEGRQQQGPAAVGMGNERGGAGGRLQQQEDIL